MSTALVASAIAVVLSAVLVGVVRYYALTAGVFDRPNERSSHVHPTPRGGGAGVVAAMLVVLFAMLSRQSHLEADWRLVLALAAAIPTAIVGWVDDRGEARVATRLLVHISSGLLLLPLALEAGAGSLLPAILLGAWWVFATLSAINVINFMDGLDAFIGLQAVVLGSHLALLAPAGSVGRTFGVVFAGAALGFLLWNWPPAKIFLGDVGSGALGVLGVAGGVLIMRESRLGIMPVFLPLFPIFLDAAVTLARRWRRGERLTQAHRSHLYQRLANGGWGHTKVSILYAVAAAVALAAMQLVPGNLRTLAGLVYVALMLFVGWRLEQSVTSA